ncbi:MAG: hypothetical protein M1838_002796 [Thelocarpon superellum]|nr:MAG: hypothetical protein M1838_002796 [Thelocarpon superellum]
MDLANTLIRSVARAFYETKHVLVVDALMVHSALRDDDLAHLLGMQTKELRKLCAKLEEHRLLAVHNRQEAREGTQRPITKTYYYVDYRQTLDAIKYRMYRVGKEVEGMIKPTEEKKDYFCPRCKAQWTALEVLDNIGPEGFLCHRCGGLLQRDESVAGDRGGHEKQSKLNSQLKPLLELLPQIDDVFIPESVHPSHTFPCIQTNEPSSSFEKAISVAVPVLRNQTTNPIAPSVPLNGASGGIPTAVKGLSQTAAQKIEVSLTSTDERTLAEQAADEERKAALAKQNALPVWISNSTVTGYSTGAGNGAGADAGVGAAGTMAHDRVAVAVTASSTTTKIDEAGTEEKRKTEELNDELAGYYQLMAQEKEKEAMAQQLEDEEEEEGEEGEEEDEEAGEDEEEDEGEFEDVVVDVNAPTHPTPTNGTTATATATAITSTNIDGKLAAAAAGQETSPSKRVKLDHASTSTSTPTSGSASTPNPTHGPVKADQTTEAERKDSEEDEDDDDDDQVEFEDV